jgi:hypothetical protein
MKRPLPRSKSPTQPQAIMGGVWDDLAATTEANDKISFAPPLMVSEGPYGKIISLAVFSPGFFPVTVTQDGGSAGTNSPAAAATYTYTVKDLSGSQLGTTIPVVWARQKGHVTAASNGMAYYDNTGTLKLAIVDEVIDTSAC